MFFMVTDTFASIFHSAAISVVSNLTPRTELAFLMILFILKCFPSTQQYKSIKKKFSAASPSHQRTSTSHIHFPFQLGTRIDTQVLVGVNCIDVLTLDGGWSWTGVCLLEIYHTTSSLVFQEFSWRWLH